MTRDTAVTRERVHHPAVGGNGEGATEEHGSNDDDLGDMGQSAIVGRGVLTHHQNDGTLLADSVKEDLGYGFAGGGVDGPVEVLD